MWQANVWFAQNYDGKWKKYIQNIVEHIELYDEENLDLKIKWYIING